MGWWPTSSRCSHWPTFNVADACITVGVVVLVASMVFCPSDGLDGHERPGRRLVVEVPPLLAGVRVDRAVAMLANVSRAVATGLIAAGAFGSTERW